MKAALLALAAAAAVGSASGSDDPCGGFGWNVAHEQALFAASPEPLTAGSDIESAPGIEADRLYELALVPRDRVRIKASSTGKSHGSQTGYAGLVRVRIPTAGSYRVSVSAPTWIDAVSGTMLVAASDFAGRRGCDAPHKTVQFELEPGTLALQFAGAASERVRITLTRAPAQPPTGTL